MRKVRGKGAKPTTQERKELLRATKAAALAGDPIAALAVSNLMLADSLMLKVAGKPGGLLDVQ